ncbi:MAG: TolC family protein, partial [Candidatus Omnitrophica bacterium]|nr:TolC family protein [Candidatus Omnitrophota bacterium]
GKMRKRLVFAISLIIIAVFTFNIVFAGYAEECPLLEIGLDETIERALDTSEELKIKDKEVDKSEGAYREERAEMLPHFTAKSQWTRNLSYPDSAAAEIADYESESTINASQVLWSFGRVLYAVNSAKKAVEATRFNRDATREEIIYTAKLSYYSCLLAKNTLSITEKSYENALENKKLLGQRSYGGRSSRYEILRMNTDVAARVPTVNEARTEFDAAVETLKRLIDVDHACNISLLGDFKDQYESYDYEALVFVMAEREPYLKSLDKTIESADAKAKSKFAALFPTVSAFSSWGYAGGGNEHSFPSSGDLDNYSLVGFKIDIPIWEGGLKQAQLSQSRATKDIAVLRKQQVWRNYMLELKKAFLEYEQYKDNLKANIEAVDLAQESFKQTQEMFASGQVTLTDLNDAELLLTNQRLNKEMTLFNINITLARIEKLIAEKANEMSGVKKS